MQRRQMASGSRPTSVATTVVTNRHNAKSRLIVPQSNAQPHHVRLNQRRPIKRFVAAGLFMALVAMAGYSLVSDSHIGAGEPQPAAVATRSDLADKVEASPPALPAATPSLGSNLNAAPATLSPTEIAAMQAEMDAYSFEVDALVNTRADGSGSVENVIETTLDTMMITLHSMIAQVDAQPQTTPTAVIVAPSMGE